ncbi:hypothetical protein OS189_00035 [Sulfitobacter sp. F26169L]|uniref:hypothetical protein n=1 Tax=Sulfitobacter sp. F26169L TaxID=2996015 RepID=UPI002260C5C2|nr:hypothetical protein [Sulfitobacter sp. F26169L]MCX7564729.1 hypothetical protein [Sulfitobacter sp. F26169L]
MVRARRSTAKQRIGPENRSRAGLFAQIGLVNFTDAMSSVVGADGRAANVARISLS